MSGPRNVCVFSERPDVTLELLAAGRKLAGDGGTVSTVAGDRSAAEEQRAHGADRVFVIDAGGDSDAGEAWLEALARVVADSEPVALLIGATALGTEISSRLAQRLGIGCASECNRLELDNGTMTVERTCLGRFIERQVIETRPAIATVRPRRFEPPQRDAERAGEITTLEITAPASRVRMLESRRRETSAVRIDRAEIVVGVGRGLRGKQDLRIIDELAEALGGVVGASRPLTDDLQWLSPDRKVGLSGVTVKPRLYIACGISGQIEHNVGMRESGVVVAINTDPGAPIMQQADYCVTGDLHDVVPALTAAIKKKGDRSIL